MFFLTFIHFLKLLERESVRKKPTFFFDLDGDSNLGPPAWKAKTLSTKLNEYSGDIETYCPQNARVIVSGCKLINNNYIKNILTIN